MRIVKDAIAQIKAKMFIPSEGTYLRLLDEDRHEYFPGYNESIQKLLEKDKCDCCAKGAIFASCVLNVNKVDGKDKYTEEYFIKSKLKKWFSPLELDMIETAFEQRIVIDTTDKLENNNYDEWGDPTPTKLAEKCIKFGIKYNNSKKRLIAILENVLKNKKFKP